MDKTKGLIEEAYAKLTSLQKEYEEAEVKCAIIGMSGSGKSSLINAIAGERIAKVGVVETTMEPTRFQHGQLIFEDLPGCGTVKFPKDRYVEEMRLDQYDCFILVTSNRFYEDDASLYLDITAKLKKRVFVVRNKFDVAVQDAMYDNGQSEKEVRDQITANIRENLKPNEIENVYLVSARHPTWYDLPQLLTDILNSLDGIKRTRFAADMAAWNEDALAEKRNAAEHVTGIYSGLAAANALNPVPGVDVSVDVGLLLKLSHEVAFIYGMTQSQAEYLSKLLKNPLACLGKVAQLSAKYLTKEAILLVLKSIGARVAVKNASKWIPFVGTLVSSYLGYRLTYSYGEDLIKEYEDAAKQILADAV